MNRLPLGVMISRDTSAGHPWGAGDLAVLFGVLGPCTTVVRCRRVERKDGRIFFSFGLMSHE